MGGNNKTTSSLVKQNMHLFVSSFPVLHKQLILEVAYLPKTKMSWFLIEGTLGSMGCLNSSKMMQTRTL